MTLERILTLAAALFIVFGGARAAAETEVATYALLVGSNEGGDGQGRLAYAERDTERVAELLHELGRTPSDHIAVLKHPRAAELETALGTLHATVAARAARGERSQVLFYYSGHARAHALSLGREDVSLDELRKSLVELPSTLTVVVLDACQSGAFSRVKGAAPAADFSLHSVGDLHSAGVAVMASSTGTELSQESSELEASYFTHHLLVALRGAGDRDGDGRVSLDESYRYAYVHTLSDTARTRVGSQHATLETELRGRGDVALSYPVDADARLVLPAEFAGRVHVQKSGRGAVLAELVKAKGAAIVLALPSGTYDVVTRQADEPTPRSCVVVLPLAATVALDTSHCARLAVSDTVAKGDESARGARSSEPWFFELGLRVHSSRQDGYTRTLEEFDFNQSFDTAQSAEIAAGRKLHKYVSVLARFDTLERRKYEREVAGPSKDTRNDEFGWRTYTTALGLRARLPILNEWLVAFAEADLGLATSKARFAYDTRAQTDHKFGVAMRGAVGLTFGFFRYGGGYISLDYSGATALRNDIGQTHSAAGISVATGIRVRGFKGL